MKNIFKKLTIFIVIFSLLSGFTVFASIDVKDDITAALCGDFETGEIFYEYNSNEVVEIASITKLMTYLLAMDALKEGEVALTDMVTISDHVAATKGSSFGLKAGEEILFSTLIDSILIVSGNDSAVAIAEHVSGSEEAFVKKMEEKAQEIGIETARFINPNGMPIDLQESDQNYMSTQDLFKLTRYIIKEYPETTDTTDKERLILPERNFDKESTNPLLPEMEIVDGLKTGYTDRAGLCLISTAPVREEDKNKDRRVISIIMGARSHRDRIEKSIDLLEYGLYEYNIEKIINSNDILDNIVVPNGKEMILDVKVEEDYYHLIKLDSKVKTVMNYDKFENLAPINQGDLVGELEIYVNDELIDNLNIVASKDIKKAWFFTRAFRFISSFF